MTIGVFDGKLIFVDSDPTPAAYRTVSPLLPLHLRLAHRAMERLSDPTRVFPRRLLARLIARNIWPLGTKPPLNLALKHPALDVEGRARFLPAHILPVHLIDYFPYVTWQVLHRRIQLIAGNLLLLGVV